MLTKHLPTRKATAKSLLIIVLIVSGLTRPALAQTQFAGWAATFQNYKLSPRFGIFFDAQWRSTDQLKQMHQLLLRPGVNIYITPALTATVGYAYIPQQRKSGGVEGYLPEHRIWEQLVFTHPVNASGGQSSAHRHPATTISHRVRVEQRYLPRHHAENNSLVHDGHRNANRIRYFIRGVVPLCGQASSSAAGSPDSKRPPFVKGWFAALQNEIFFNVGDASAVNGKVFDQNRAYVAAGYRLSRQFDMEIGYLNQYISGAGSATTTNHVVQLATYVRL